MSSTAPGDTALIGVDWGTSNLRVMRIDASGAVLESRSDPRGAGGLAPAEFPVVLSEVAGAWLNGGLPVLCCGMAGARGRWLEVAYRPTPTTMDDLSLGLRSPAGNPGVRIVPGLMAMAGGRMIDVMRGEETQIMGLDVESGSRRIVAPGTHSKWVHVRQGRIIGFRTFMTGELFDAIRRGTLLGADMDEPGGDAEAFAAGVDRALREPALTAALFSVRVEVLAERMKSAAAADYLSGLLIGAEIAAHNHDSHGPVTLVGAGKLNARYVNALGIAGFSDIRVADGIEATALGLWRIHQASLR